MIVKKRKKKLDYAMSIMFNYGIYFEKSKIKNVNELMRKSNIQMFS